MNRAHSKSECLNRVFDCYIREYLCTISHKADRYTVIVKHSIKAVRLLLNLVTLIEQSDIDNFEHSYLSPNAKQKCSQLAL